MPFTIPNSFGSLKEFNQCHSKADGRFCSSLTQSMTPEEAALQNHLVDFKLERGLTGPDSKPISGVIDNARTSQYIKVPGLATMHAAMGVTPTLQTDPREYQAARDALFNTMPLEQVPFEKLIYTQPRVNVPRVKQLVTATAQLDKPVQILKMGSHYYVMNGHHRVAAAFMAGRTAIVGRVFDAEKHR